MLGTQFWINAGIAGAIFVVLVVISWWIMKGRR